MSVVESPLAAHKRLCVCEFDAVNLLFFHSFKKIDAAKTRHENNERKIDRAIQYDENTPND